MTNTLTPEQRDCIRQATEALEKLRDLMPVETDNLTPEEFTEGANKTQDELICRVYNLTPEEVYMVVTCNGQREMTLERFKDALRHLTI